MISAAALAALPAFRAFPPSDIDVLLGVATERRFRPGAALCREGEAARSCFVLVAGEVEITRSSGTGPLRLSRLGAGAILGQIALLDRRARSASVHALTEVTALELPREVFDRLLVAESPFGLRFQELVAVNAIRQLRAATRRVAAHRARRQEPPAAHPAARSDLHGAQAMLQEWSISEADLDAVTFVPTAPRTRGPRSPR